MTLVDFLLFIFFSVIETSSLFYMMFKVFKIDIYPIKIIFAGLIMGFISYVLRNDYQFIEIDVIVQTFLLFCFVWMMFQIHIFYAIILAQMAYQTYVLIQTTYYYLMLKVGAFGPEFPVISNISTYILQIISALTAVYIGWIIVKKRKGFDFVPDKPSGKLQIKYRDKILFILCVPSFIILTLCMYLASNYNKIFYILPFLYTATLAGYLYFSYRKDRGE